MSEEYSKKFKDKCEWEVMQRLVNLVDNEIECPNCGEPLACGQSTLHPEGTDAPYYYQVSVITWCPVCTPADIIEQKFVLRDDEDTGESG